ncbi:hypothetical protein [Providencia sp. JUb39]|uniref:hypothetical protein n=1 Tax=Providencia sp. JUb39 TaxID=2724165 RepID=UPI00164D22D6|nr:hypothetical protein [Providencia sp. JUb39]MBC5790644.1 hypothetical protein [Providencia sp. JUb39]
MSRYKVLKKSFIAGRLLEVGEEVEYSGVAGSNLKLIGGDDAKSDAGTVVDGAGGDNGEIVTNAAISGSGDTVDSSLEALREQYTQLFGKAPHHNMGADKMRTAIDERRKELAI